MAAAFLNTAMPAQLVAAGSRMMSSRSHTVRTQSSRRPIMSVHTGVMRDTSLPSASRRRSARSTASPTASAWGTVKLTVALMEIPS